MVARPVAVVLVVVVVGIYTALGTAKDPIERETLGGRDMRRAGDLEERAWNRNMWVEEGDGKCDVELPVRRSLRMRRTGGGREGAEEEVVKGNGAGKVRGAPVMNMGKEQPECGVKLAVASWSSVLKLGTN